MTELEFKKKMQHLLEINTELYKENQVLKKALAYQEERANSLEKWKVEADKDLISLNVKIEDLIDEIQDIHNNNWDE